jgi:hypothetical protein
MKGLDYLGGTRKLFIESIIHFEPGICESDRLNHIFFGIMLGFRRRLRGSVPPAGASLDSFPSRAERVTRVLPRGETATADPPRCGPMAYLL